MKSVNLLTVLGKIERGELQPGEKLQAAGFVFELCADGALLVTYPSGQVTRWVKGGKKNERQS